MTVVVDASAVMALMLDESGAGIVADVIRTSLMSSVNLSECCARAVERGASPDAVLSIVHGYEVVIVPFTLDEALETARLRQPTRPVGASLGDRACMALGRMRKIPIFTSDRRLADIDPGLGIDIRLIR